MELPTQLAARCVAPETYVLPAWFPIPGLGLLPMSSFLVRGREPMLIDCGPAPLADDLISELERLVDLEDLRWIWLTHTDPDHIGAVPQLIERAPNARFVTTFLGAGKMAMHTPLPPERTYLLNPGGRLGIGDREIVALRPPVYDAPETTAAFDPSTGVLFAADCFGTLVQRPVDEANELRADELADGMLTWAGIDAPWLEHLSPPTMRGALGSLEALAPRHVLGSHLPPAHGMTDALVACLSRAAGAAPFVGPDQAALEAAS